MSVKSLKTLTKTEDIMAVRFLAQRTWATPAQIGQAIRLDRTDPMTPKELERSGKKVARRLVRLRYAEPAYTLKFGAYALTLRGRHSMEGRADLDRRHKP